MPGIFNVEWLDANSQRIYPLAESATAIDRTGSFRLPPDFLLELYLPVQAAHAVDVNNFFLAAVAVFPAGYSLTIAYDDGSTTPPIVAATVIAKSAHQENNSYALPGINDFDAVVGRVTIGVTDSIDLQPAGQYVFTPAGGRLDPDCIRPQLRGVNSLAVVNGSDNSGRRYGDFELVAGANFQISLAVVGGVTQVRFDAIAGAGLNDPCACDQPSGPPIMTIAGVQPDATGNLALVGTNCMTVNPLVNGISLSDQCSQPCCGCAELEALTSELAQFGSEAATLRDFVTRLQNEVGNMGQTILASKLGDRGCKTC